ncbi:MAG: hypothetical protein ACPIDW_02580 [Candidatus Puniceispirillaceae bacterium]
MSGLKSKRGMNICVWLHKNWQIRSWGSIISALSRALIWSKVALTLLSPCFSGNIALKTAEGVAGLFATLLRRSFKASLSAKLGYLLAQGALKNFRTKMDPRRYNGAVFLGLNGIAVKSHGGTDAVGFANAIDVAMNLVGHGFIPDVSAAIEKADRIRAERKSVDE